MGKNFDLFIDHKNQFPEHLRKYIVRAKLFEFDCFPTETLDEAYYKEIPELTYNFCLPFPVVAVEDKTSCVILWDQQKDSVGIEHERGMMEVADTRNYLDEKSFKLSSQDKLRGRTEKEHDTARESLTHIANRFGEYPVMIRWGQGTLNWRSDIRKWRGSGETLGAKYLLPKKEDALDLMKLIREDPSYKDHLDTDMMRGLITSYEELLRMSVKTLFIQETKPKKQSKNKYRKTFERPVYTVLRPDAARRSMGLKSPKRTKSGEIRERRAHIRREHTRELRSEVFKHKQGQTVEVRRAYIPAVWEGPSESEDNKHYYRVILDLPKGLRDSCS